MYDAGSRCERLTAGGWRLMHALHATCCEIAMASVLTIRKLPDDCAGGSCANARQHAGRSVEAEAREIIASACLPRRMRRGGMSWRERARQDTATAWLSRVPSSFGKVVMRVDEVPERIVVDASLGLKWVLIEEHSDRAVALGPGRELLTSALFWAEVGNAIAMRVRRRELDGTRAEQTLRELQSVPLRTRPFDGGSGIAALAYCPRPCASDL